MPNVDLVFRPGVIADNTPTAVGQAGFISADKVRFRGGLPEVIGGWQTVVTDQVDGVCRGARSWRDSGGVYNYALGTTEGLWVVQGGDMYDITPSGFVDGQEDGVGGLGYGTGLYGNGYYSRASTASTYALTWSMASWGENLLACPRGQGIFHWQNDGSTVAAALGRSVNATDDLSYADQTASDAVWTRGTGWTLDAANDQFDCDGSQSGTVTCLRDWTGLTVGKIYLIEIPFSGRTAGSISASFGGKVSTSTSEASGTVWVAFQASSTSHEGGVSVDADFIGSIDADITLYELNAPDEVTAITVFPEKRQAVAIGCNEVVSNVFNPRCIRVCDFADLTEWAPRSSNNAVEIILECEGELVAAEPGAGGVYVWTTSELFYMTYTGAPGTLYSLTRLGAGCGARGPNAATVLSGVAYWASRDGSFWTCQPSGVPQKIYCPVQDDYADNFAAVQDDKIYSAAVARYGEIWWFYPDSRDGNECSRYVMYSTLENVWATGQLDRTAYVDGGPNVAPVAVDASGSVFYHELGDSANGAPIEWSLRTGDIAVAEGGRDILLRGAWPDVADQAGTVTYSYYAKQFPQDTETLAASVSVTANQSKADFLASGRYFQIEMSGSAAPCRFRLGKMTHDVVVRGRGHG